jgi:hypothetical protein
MKCVVCKTDFQMWRCRACPGAEVQTRQCPDCHKKVVHGPTRKIKRKEK